MKVIKKALEKCTLGSLGDGECFQFDDGNDDVYMTVCLESSLSEIIGIRSDIVVVHLGTGTVSRSAPGFDVIRVNGSFHIE